MTLQDRFGRRFLYLRLSVTDACNFRCTYCLPNGYQRPPQKPPSLSVSEIKNLVSAFAEMGTQKVRLTGGEPTLRQDITEIVSEVASISGIRKVALTTNGYRLKNLARELHDAGLTAINISADTLDAKRFHSVTGHDRLEYILEGIEECLRLGFDSVKVNAVLLKDVNDKNQNDFLSWIRERPVSVRFIELMPTAGNKDFFSERHVRAASLRASWLSQGWTPKARGPADGPAEEYVHEDFAGTLGIIAPYANEFCSTCNRLRVTSQGELRLCLFGDSNISLREFLQNESQKERLKSVIVGELTRKEISHYLPEGRYGNNTTFSAMGG